MKKYDLIVLGGGTAGMTLARSAAAKGWQVAAAESRYLGGSCINIGCTPSKALIYSAKLMHLVRTAGEYGIRTPAPQAEWKKVVERKNNVVQEMRQGSYRSVEKNDNITLYEEPAKFSGPQTVAVGERELEADKILIATGAGPAIAPIPGLEEAGYLTSTTAMEMESLPGSLLILGGGMIAVEFAQMFARFGVQVTIVQRSKQVGKKLEDEIASALQTILKNEGVEILTGTDILGIRRQNGRIALSVEREGKKQTLTADDVLVATGRKPNTDHLELDKAGVETDKKGFIKIDSSFATNVPGIWAAGDVVGGAMFTHKAWHDGMLLAKSLLQGKSIDNTDRLIPYAVFTDPEIAGVGLGEKQAKDQGIDVKVQQYPFKHVGRARATGRLEGLVKLITDQNNGKIIGAHIIGPEAAEIIHELVMAMRFNATVTDLQEMIHIHPTLSEAINSAGLST
ncbi:dihydrolipoyl dehydrogenase [Dethiobacter alkaliphilus]|uniref:Dihydrolipoyl dehydrogenase n=1 Tax=Dethiobacter alkaliphilus AHT 1 TaxID=555088 RepID=C0GFM9_DETAL|nr:dihydrolipoyl dehydrogenase [Dethiobacter alkaliphilus]EEG77989.1 dihydrolipoamide dehydrogenase [Dethiobacter alkaliphilus AHT 1]